MEENKSVLIEFFGDYPLIRILDFLVENRGLDYSKTELCRSANTSWGSLFGLWEKLVRLGIVKETRRFGKTKLYKLNEKSAFVQKLMALELELIKFYAELDTEGKTKKTAIASALKA
ncbi:MAG: hypothetical protein HYW05_04670 [Candidatus Diapherotrites archaeon]|nr:hypothetical protein [Candidatus Diapherotrites archaeon]